MDSLKILTHLDREPISIPTYLPFSDSKKLSTNSFFIRSKISNFVSDQVGNKIFQDHSVVTVKAAIRSVING